jgi:hypothetical protein
MIAEARKGLRSPIAVGLLAGALLLVHSAPSGWPYPTDCCNGSDCAPIPTSAVEELPEGSVVVKVTGEKFWPPHHPRASAMEREWRWSQDQDFHRCANPENPRGRTYCLFVPGRGA